METKILIGILLIASLIIGIGIVVAHGNENKDDSETEVMHNDMGEMHEIMESMMGGMHEEMMEEMEEIMNNELLREEMLEHMKDCPMMKPYA